MSKYLYAIIASAFIHSICMATPRFACESGVVSVATDRYEVRFRDGSLFYLKNQLTGDLYTIDASSSAKADPTTYRGLCHFPENPSKTEAESLTETHQWFSSRNRNFPQFDFTRHPDSKSRLEFKQSAPNKARATWKGLSGGSSKDWFALELEVLAPSGDLQIVMRGEESESGTAAAALLFENFNPKLDYIVPILQGFKFKPSEEKPFTTTAHWPRPWSAPLLIAENKEGAFGVWIADPGTTDRYLYLFNRSNRFDFTFELVNHAPFSRYKEITTPPIRLNVYKGNWLKPAAAFKTWWSETFKPNRKKDRPGAQIRAIAQNSQIPTDMPGKFVHFAAQDWKKFDHVGDQGLFPKNIQAGPELAKLTPEFLEKTRRLGGFNMVYQNVGHMNNSHPDAEKYYSRRVVSPFASEKELKRKGEGKTKIDPRIMAKTSFHVNCAYQPWQKLQRWWANQINDRFGIKGIYLDVAAGQPNSQFGKIDEKSDADGLLELMRIMKKDRPDRFITVEYLSSLTAREADGGWLGYDNWFVTTSGYPSGPTWRMRHVHPLLGYLFNDYAYLYWKGHNSVPAFNEVLGRIAMTPFYEHTEKDTVMDYATKYSFPEFWGRFLASRNLSPDYPEDWDPAVKAYYRDDEGNRYELHGEIPGEGVLYEVSPLGKHTLVYHRVIGRNKTKIESGRGVEGWIAYADDHAIGLDPARNYYYFGNPRISDWEIIQLPDNCKLTNVCPFKTGLLKLSLAKLDSKKPLQGSLKLLSAYPLHHATVNGMTIPLTASGKVGNRDVYRIDITQPGQVAFTSETFAAVKLDPQGIFSLLSIQPDYAVLDKSGIRKLYSKRLIPKVWENSFRLFGGLKQSFQLNFLVHLPQIDKSDKLVLEFTPHAAKWRKRDYKYRLAVNVDGVKRWENMIASDKEAKSAQVELTSYAGKDILLCFDYYTFLTVTPFKLENPRITRITN